MQSLRAGWGMWAVLVIVILIAAAPILTYPLGRDQGEFAIIGTGILRGSVPYVDLWNPKPPAIFYTYAAAIRVFGQTEMGLRAIDLLLFPILAAALYDIGRRLENPALGLWSVLLYGVFYFTESFWTLTQNDGIAAVPMTLAVWCVFALLDGERPRVYAFLCGALCALTLWFKYPFVTFVVAVIISYLSVRRRWVWGEVIAFSAGGLLIGLGGMAYLGSIGAFSAWIESAQVTAGYTAQGYNFLTFIGDMWRYIGFRWRQWHILWLLSGVGLVLQIRGLITHKPTETHNFLVTDAARWRIIVLWLAGSATAMLIQAKGYDYHWLPMLPPLTLLGGYSVNQFLRLAGSYEQLPQWASNGLISLVLITLLITRTWGTAMPYLMGSESPQDYRARFIGGQFVADESYSVATYLQNHISPENTLFIWGFRPEIYYMSHLRPATRFIFQFPLVADWYPPEWQQQTVDSLWASLPPYVLVARGDHMPWVTGIDADSNTLLQDYTELNNWLMYNYERETEIGSFLIWRRKDPG